MDMVNIVSQCGIPFASFLMCAYFLKYVYDKSMSVVSDLTEAVNNNTVTLTRLVEKIGEKEE